MSYHITSYVSAERPHDINNNNSNHNYNNTTTNTTTTIVIIIIIIIISIIIITISSIIMYSLYFGRPHDVQLAVGRGRHQGRGADLL